MKVSLLLVLALGCGKPTAPAPASLAQLISPQARSVMRTKIELFPILAVSKELIDPGQPCWPALVDKVTSAYQVLVDGSSYFIVEGKLAREDLEACIPAAFKLNPKIKDDDGMLVVESPIGTVYGAFRGDFLVFGTRAQVVDATATHDPAVAATWTKLLPTQPSAMAMASIDTRYVHLMGTDIADFSFALDRMASNPPSMAGTFKVHYKSPEAAAKGMAYIKDWSGRGKFPATVPAEAPMIAALDAFAALVAKLDFTLSGNELAIVFDSDRLGGPAFFDGLKGYFEQLPVK